MFAYVVRRIIATIPVMAVVALVVFSLLYITHGDLGTSIFTNLPVTTMIAQRFEPTLSLMAVTLCLSIAVAVPMGVVAAWKAGTFIDRLIMAFAVFGFSVLVV